MGDLGLGKADAALRDQLNQANADDSLRALFRLALEETRSERPVRDLSESPREYRSRLIEAQRRHLDAQLGDTLERLRAFSLEVFPVTLFPVAVVEGTAENLLRALEDPGVVSAVLDGPLQFSGKEGS